jgi:hypothetical protein
MSEILEKLGLDEDNVAWQDLAACKNIVSVSESESGEKKIFDPMFDSYENDSAPYAVRNAIDELCLSCPVQKICYDYGTRNGEPGVWGGVYLSNGKADRSRNDHKNKETWKRLREALA